MIVGTGVDLAEVPRIRASIERFGERFVRRIYTAAEIAYVERKANRYERYAARFAAKEAGMKAIGTGWKRGVTWQDFEVTNLPSGKPTLRFHGSIPALTEQLKNLMAAETRIVLAAAHQGDVERLATMLREYQIPYRLGSLFFHPGGETVACRTVAVHSSMDRFRVADRSF